MRNNNPVQFLCETIGWHSPEYTVAEQRDIYTCAHLHPPEQQEHAHTSPGLFLSTNDTSEPWDGNWKEISLLISNFNLGMGRTFVPGFIYKKHNFYP